MDSGSDDVSPDEPPDEAEPPDEGELSEEEKSPEDAVMSDETELPEDAGLPEDVVLLEEAVPPDMVPLPEAVSDEESAVISGREASGSSGMKPALSMRETEDAAVFRVPVRRMPKVTAGKLTLQDIIVDGGAGSEQSQVCTVTVTPFVPASVAIAKFKALG